MVVFASLLICLPLGYLVFAGVFVLMMNFFTGWLTYYIAPVVYVKIVIIGMTSYLLVHMVQMRRIRKVPIGRAVVKNPDLLLCDEPTGALDYHTSKDILKLIDDVNRKYDTTVIMVTHNEALAAMADTVIHVKDGMIIAIDKNPGRTSVMDLEW